MNLTILSIKKTNDLLPEKDYFNLCDRGGKSFAKNLDSYSEQLAEMN